MKIGVTTFHFAKNYGAVLQCYALTHWLDKQGHDAKVIDYRPLYHTIRYTDHTPVLPFLHYEWIRRKKLPFGERAKTVWTNLKKAKKAEREKTEVASLKMFEDFRAAHLDSTKRYTSYAQLKNDPPEMDALITGSDQLWNPDLLNQELDPVYFVDFGKADAVRIAYAVSLGRELVGGELDDLRRYCARMNAVSIREQSETAANAMQRDVHVCVDPTMLLDAADYAAVEAPALETEPYIFVYGFKSNVDDVRAAVEVAKKRYGCRVLNGSPTKIDLGDDVDKVYDYGPAEFLTYFKNAACVVTNSFHGTSFSVIYQKDFITIPHAARPARMVELLAKLGLSYRLWSDKSFSFDRAIDYDAVRKNVLVQRGMAEEYLTLALQGVKGEDIPHHPEETI